MIGAASQSISYRCMDFVKLCHRSHASDTVQQPKRVPGVTAKLHIFRSRSSIHLLQWLPNMAADIMYTYISVYGHCFFPSSVPK